MTILRAPRETTTVCVEFHVDLRSRIENRGWRVPMAVEAVVPVDTGSAVPVLAECTLAKSAVEAEEAPTVYLDFGGRVLRSFEDPHGHLQSAREKLPEAARRFL